MNKWSTKGEIEKKFKCNMNTNSTSRVENLIQVVRGNSKQKENIFLFILMELSAPEELRFIFFAKPFVVDGLYKCLCDSLGAREWEIKRTIMLCSRHGQNIFFTQNFLLRSLSLDRFISLNKYAINAQHSLIPQTTVA